MKKQSLWTKNFSLITITTVLSAIGGEAMNLPISLLVFDETKSTLMASLIMVCGMLPDIVLPILIAPIIDKGTKKRWIVGLDALMAVLFAVMGIYILNHRFMFVLYVVFTLVIGTISVFYRLAYDAWYPDLIPAGFEQKGYAVSGTIYPLVTIVMAPVATFLYQEIALGIIFIIVAVIGVFDVILEMMITEKRSKSAVSFTWKSYTRDIAEGFTFLKKEKGIRNIYTYMSITNGASYGVAVVTQAFYQTQAWLTVTMLGFLKSSETVGRVFGGLIQYKKEIPVKKRYAFTKLVYTTYDLMDSSLLFMPYPAMLLNRFLCGILGSQSATIRSAAVQSYLPQEMRARINALFGVIFAVGGILFQLAAGLLGQLLPYRIAALILGLTTFTSMFIFIWIPKEANRKVYEATRVKAEESLEAKAEENPEKNLEVKAEENLEVNPKESLEVNPEENLEVKAEENLEVKAEKSPEVKAEENLEIKTEESLEVKAEENLEVKAEENLEVKAEENLEVKAEENLEVKAEESLGVKTEENLEVRAEESLEVKLEESPEVRVEETVNEA